MRHYEIEHEELEVEEGSVCASCGRVCKPTVVNFGIGPYEFWGQRGVDSNKQVVSDCCEDEILPPPEVDDVDE